MSRVREEQPPLLSPLLLCAYRNRWHYCFVCGDIENLPFIRCVKDPVANIKSLLAESPHMHTKTPSTHEINLQALSLLQLHTTHLKNKQLKQNSHISSLFLSLFITLLAFSYSPSFQSAAFLACIINQAKPKYLSLSLSPCSMLSYQLI